MKYIIYAYVSFLLLHIIVLTKNIYGFHNAKKNYNKQKQSQ